MVSLGEAAQRTGVSRSTLLRMIKTGKLSAIRVDGRFFQFDPAELARVFPDASKNETPTRHDAPSPDHSTPGPVADLQAKIAVLEAELAGLRQLRTVETSGLRELVEAERRRAETAEMAMARLAAPADASQRATPGLLTRLFGRKVA